jgi:hypothetical protein
MVDLVMVFVPFFVMGKFANLSDEVLLSSVPVVVVQ